VEERERDGASEKSEEIITKSRMCFLLWVRKFTCEVRSKDEQKKLRGEMICEIIKMY